MVEKLTTLVEKSMKGDKEALEELIACKQREILYITSRFCNPQDLEDCAQEAMLLIYKNLNQLRDPSCFNDWMYNVIRNVCFCWNRKKKRRNSIAEITPFDPSGEGYFSTMEEDREEFMPVEYLESKEKREEVISAVNELPEIQRECMILFFYEEMSYKEIANALNTDIKKVSNNLFRAKQELKKRLSVAIEKNKIFSVPSVSAIPIMTQILRADAKAKIPQELCDKMAKQTISKLSQAGVIQGAAAGVLGGTAASKTAIGIISVLAITGISMGTIHHVKQDVPAIRLETAGLQMDTGQILKEASQTAHSLVKPIETLADMIGEAYEKKLITYEQLGVEPDVWSQFIRDIGAEELTRTGTTKGNIYKMYVLEKQDKQLLMVTWESPGQKLLKVTYEFGAIQEEPDINYFIMLFSQ